MIRILIVEDDPSIQKALKELLETEHYFVDQSFDGLSGIEKTMSLNPDLILLDLNLPGKNGYDICRELRARKFYNPIIILSSKTDQIDKVIGLEIGADDYMTKPFHSRELIARIHANLRKVKRDDTEHEYQKKLCTIFFSDMYGYSEKMNHDELSALKLLTEHNYILKSTISKFSGRIIEIIGDAFLASFESVSSAAECACVVHEEFSIRNRSVEENEKIFVRIGIHLGEVFIFTDNIKGDVLNIAFRVQQLASPGTALVTSSVHDVLKSSKNFSLEFKGSYRLKNIDNPFDLFSLTRVYLPVK